MMDRSKKWKVDVAGTEEGTCHFIMDFTGKVKEG